jgi:hypothetical protein
LTAVKGDEVAQLPTIVEASESSPVASKKASDLLRRYLSKEYYGQPHIQYNSIMLLRILATNPGPGFTRNLDSKFVGTVKDCLKSQRDPSVQQILRETLESFNPTEDVGLTGLAEMWGKEKNNTQVSVGA